MSNQESYKIQSAKNHLLEKAILPVVYSHRSISDIGYLWMWICMAVIIATFSIGAAGIAGLDLVTVAITVFLANLALVVMLFTADIGTEHGLSFAVFLRAPFGTVGTHLPSVSRGIVAAI